MKNTEKYKLHKCIFMMLEEFEDLIAEVTDGLKIVVYDGVSFWYEDTEKAEETDTYWNQYIHETLSGYFDVEVTSIHFDSDEYVGVWIVYR